MSATARAGSAPRPRARHLRGAAVALAALALLCALVAAGAWAARRPARLPRFRVEVAAAALYAPCRDADTFYTDARGCIDDTGRPRAGAYGIWLALPPPPGGAPPPPVRLL